MNSILNDLGIGEDNYGACTGKDNWFPAIAQTIGIIQPTNSKLIAKFLWRMKTTMKSFKHFS